MAEGKEIPVAANVLGTIGTVLWCIQLVPQIWYNWRRKNTDGLPASMMLLWALCAPPFGIYMILQGVNIPIQIQPQIFGTLCLICWAQILVYHHNYTRVKATVITLALAVLLGGSEVLFILTLRVNMSRVLDHIIMPLTSLSFQQIPYRKGITWPALLFGILATILLVLGLMSPYQEIWKRRGRVVGINWVFLTMDTFGALFSLLALVVESSFDVLGGVMYCVVLALEIGIFGSHIVWRLLHRDLLKEAKAAGVTIDEILEANKRTVTPSSLVESQDHVGVATVDTVEQARR
ncbi:hypothetical protein CISG_00857 [Coccidioides immitis RMSCC 3703]|uniref:PQ loop repeat protein n=3 Tax=Coccidioides TaxID=5500 RepID=A0A0J8QUI0_COCIT|nr:hypothetical protein CPAG_04173 [Coccidioides posadasii RMSCC 3488]KMP03956.1 hypothetical protein CIRG_03648 [Coccidioides immitis RMSCC 2394]KMU74928.1 hypothetical protein CISG_00857 [Coccidioides immitis RMSCC 3703]